MQATATSSSTPVPTRSSSSPTGSAPPSTSAPPTPRSSGTPWNRPPPSPTLRDLPPDKERPMPDPERMVIWKHQFPPMAAGMEVELLRDAKVLHFAEQHGQFCFWEIHHQSET